MYETSDPYNIQRNCFKEKPNIFYFKLYKHGHTYEQLIGQLLIVRKFKHKNYRSVSPIYLKRKCIHISLVDYYTEIENESLHGIILKY